MAGVSFLIYYYIGKLNFQEVRQNEELWFYISVAIAAGSIVQIIRWPIPRRSFWVAFREGFPGYRQ